MRQDNGSICKISVDGTDFCIRQVQPFWTGWFSHKFNGPAVRYEVAVSIQSGDIVWTNGPFPAGRFPDLKIFRLGLKQLLLFSRERAEADAGYRGEASCIDLPDEGVFNNPHQMDIKGKVRKRHEAVNRRFKQFSCLSQKFRHHLFYHKYFFSAVVAITQISFENGNPVYSIDNYRTATPNDLWNV